ncbi:MAG: OsmC family protein, partial [Flavobacteriaceae bacterium]
DITETKVTVFKQMAASPRRIAALNIDLYLPRSFEDKTKRLLERAALNCPVAKSLAPKLKQDVRFHWPD